MSSDPTITADEAERARVTPERLAEIMEYTAKAGGRYASLPLREAHAMAAELARLRGVVAEVERHARAAESHYDASSLRDDDGQPAHGLQASLAAILSAVGAVGEREQQLRDGALASAVERLTPLPVTHEEARGTTACPICGISAPHTSGAHAPDAILALAILAANSSLASMGGDLDAGAKLWSTLPISVRRQRLVDAQRVVAVMDAVRAEATAKRLEAVEARNRLLEAVSCAARATCRSQSMLVTEWQEADIALRAALRALDGGG